MTQQQKEQISKLRANGASFGKIASALGTIYRWCRELEGITPGEPEETDSTDMDGLLEDREKEEHPSDPSNREQTDAQDDAQEDTDTIAMAMALLVIENTHLREVIHHLRDTMSGLTDHNLL